MGPANSPYNGGKFVLEIKFPTNYPIKSPAIQFITKIYHPHIRKSGAFCECAPFSSQNWSPVITLHKALLDIWRMMDDPASSGCQCGEIWRLYANNRNTFNETAREWTHKYAIN